MSKKVARRGGSGRGRGQGGGEPPPATSPRPPPPPPPPTSTASTADDDEIAELERRIAEEAPKRGHVPPLGRRVAFRSLPVSERTLMGLEAGGSGAGGGKSGGKAGGRGRGGRGGGGGGGAKGGGGKGKSFTVMTDIQDACIPHALAGRDVLGAAKTGSGKTLAFLIPLLEKLYRLHFSPSDGPGAIVLSPTRELAVQIFEVLRSVGSYHDLSAGLLVGGKKEFGLEQARVGRTNVLIASPGRLLQHLEQTPNFDVSNVSMLVLDEADRILDMGFREQMVRILDYLPPGRRDGGARQTLLFSATQTRRLSDLAALSLDPRPVYVGVHDKTPSATPDGLKQGYVIVPLQHKLDAVFSFIKSHPKAKIIIFFASCSQVRYVWRVFCALQPGTPVMAIHGKVKQETRTKLYFDFLQRPSAVLLATDVAARGLDFPNVDWVIQADAPEDVAMYIHRAGRTARYNVGGRSLLVLLPSEQAAMVKRLEGGKIPIKKLSINPTKTVQVSRKASALVAADPDLNDLAKKAFKSYIRSVSLMPDRDVFKISELPFDEFASSLGLASTPSLRFLKKMGDREELRGKKNVNRKLEKLKEQIRAEKLKKRLERMGGGDSGAEAALEGAGTKRVRTGDDDDAVGGLLVVKKRHEWGVDRDNKKRKEEGTDSVGGEDLPDVDLHKVTRSRHPKRICIDGSTSGMNKKIIFGDDGEEEEDAGEIRGTPAIDGVAKRDGLVSENEKYLRKVQERLEGTRDIDRAEERERVREKHRKRRMKERGAREDGGDGASGGVMLASTYVGSDASVDDLEQYSSASEEEVEDGHVGRHSESASDASGDESDSDADIGVDGEDLEAQALAMIRQKG